MQETGNSDALMLEICELKRLILQGNLAQKPVYSVADVSALLGVKPKTIYNAVNRHALSAYKPEGKELYFDPEDIKKYAFRNKIRSDFEIAEMAQNR